MALRTESLFGLQDKVEVALERLRTFCPPEGFYVAFSGGKDSQCILELAKQAGVKHDAHMALTTVDPPELLRFVRANYPEVELMRPEMSMYELIVKKGVLPTRMARYCCDKLKEPGGDGRFVVTGVRWEESARRASRRMVESCLKYGSQRFLHPIIDWSTDEVWEYLTERGLPHCSLYDEGFKRIGCVMCPMAGPEKMVLDAARWPHIAGIYRNACRKAATRWTESRQWKDGDDMYDWWTNRSRWEKDAPPMESLFEEEV